MRCLLVLVVLMVESVSFAHRPPAPSSEVAGKELELVSNYLDAVFVAVSLESHAQGRDFVFVGPSGEKYFAPKTKVVDALVAGLEVASKRRSLHCSHSHGQCGHHHEPLVVLSTRQHQEPRWLSRQLDRMGDVTVNLTGGAAELARHHGLVPLVFVAATWPFFTLVTEFLESLAIGPAHVFCHVSQVAYFSALGYFLLQGHMISDAVVWRDSSRGIWKRLRAIYRSRRLSASFRSATQRVLLQSVPAVMQAGDYRKFLGQEQDAASTVIRESSLWADLHQKDSSSGDQGSLNPLSIALDFERLFAQPSESLRMVIITELKIALSVLANLVRSKMKLAYGAGELTRKEYVGRKAALGEWMRLADLFERSMWLVATNEGQDTKSAEWSEQFFRQLLASLQTIASFDSPVREASSSLRETWSVAKIPRMGALAAVASSCRAALSALSGLSFATGKRP